MLSSKMMKDSASDIMLLLRGFFMSWTFSKITLFLTTLIFSFYCQARESYLGSKLGAEGFSENHSYLLAQAATDDDSFDPFSDYSEFDEATDEEADINFFRNGRFLTVGFVMGMKGFTDNLSTAYNSGGTYGLYLAYFFDLRFAIQFGFTTGDYGFTFSTPSGQSSSGNVAFTLISINTKYFFNTQNVTKGLADLNPYLIIGLSNVFRTYTLTSSQTGQVNDAVQSAWGLDAGGGIEIPMMRKKAYFGIQGTLHYVNFPDSNSPFYLYEFTQPSTSTQAGMQYDVLALVGVNF